MDSTKPTTILPGYTATAKLVSMTPIRDLSHVGAVVRFAVENGTQCQVLVLERLGRNSIAPSSCVGSRTLGRTAALDGSAMTVRPMRKAK